MPENVVDKFPWGQWVERACQIVALDWHSVHLEDGPEADVLKYVGGAGSGVYAFEGCHDARPSGTILYVGKAGDETKGTLKTRLPESLRQVWRQCGDGMMRLHSDVWNVWIRWAEVASNIRAIEQILINAHSPAFNAQDVRKQLSPEYKNLVVMNAGQKGRLMPVVYGAYLNDDFWFDSKAGGPP